MAVRGTLEKELRLWAKTDRTDTSRFHPLLYHLLDVAAVARLFCDKCVPLRLQSRIGIGQDLSVFLAGAHDIGKACPGFQKKVRALGDAAGLPFSENDRDRPHGFVSAYAIKAFLGDCERAGLLGQIAGGHHGVFPRTSDLRMGEDTLGNVEWTKARNDLLTELARLVGLDVAQARNSQQDFNDPFVVPALAGFVSVVDWIASNQEFFPCAAECGKPLPSKNDDYWREARAKAGKALEELGWIPAVGFAAKKEFAEVFPSCANPTGVQKAVIGAAESLLSPYLLIVEATMGQGKTEAALFAADLAMGKGFARGLYVAMPTQATSNAMFGRLLDDYLKNRGHQGKLNLQIVHGNALLADLSRPTDEARDGEVKTYYVAAVEDDTGGGIDHTADLEAQSWFTAKKRPLLAPFGVGTIDQGLLSVLQTKHWFVRMFGLAAKVVVFDEVHAYDAYMSTILERLLHWLAELDCTVILLSATLPDTKRRALAKAYSGRDDAEYQRYPRITMAEPRHVASHPGASAVGHSDLESATRPTCNAVEPEATRTVRLSVQGPTVEALAESLSSRLLNGGCAAVVCNTVDRSIEVFQHLQGSLRETECLLFHARTLQVWRREREEEVLRKFGKRDGQGQSADGHFVNPDRPHRAVLVATQVVEQSLDLDFDLMVSEIAPIDLLLQRSGRLHRHPRLRPDGLKEPELIVLCDAERSGPPPGSFGKSVECVYDRYVLLLTWLALRGRSKIEVPGGIEQLIEFVYGEADTPDADGWPEALECARKKMELERSESETAARRLLVSKPKNPRDLIEQFNDQLADEEDPEVHKSVRAATREGDPSITVVALPEGDALTGKPKIPVVKSLLERSVKISHRGLFHALLENGEQPKEWKESAHLRYARLLRLDGNGQGAIDGYALHVDERLGVTITKVGED